MADEMDENFSSVMKLGVRNNHPKENINLKRENFMEIDIVKAVHPSHHQKL